jgi:hypothetical protein
MNNKEQLNELLRRPDVWIAGQRPPFSDNRIPTGFSKLDHALGGGWPRGQLTELAMPADGPVNGPVNGIGELRLLIPAISRLSHWVVLVSPPYIPYAPALVKHGLDLSRLLVIRAMTSTDVFWSMEQALRSGACSAVIGWVGNAQERTLRRLQLAAETGSSWAVLFRPSPCVGQRSPAPLRVQLRMHHASGDGLELQIVKQRSGLPATVWVNAADA